MIRDGIDTPTRAETLFNNANLLRIRSAPTATGVGDGKDLDFGSVTMVGHNVGPKRKSSTQKYGPRRMCTVRARSSAIISRSIAPAMTSGRRRSSMQTSGMKHLIPASVILDGGTN